MKYISVDIETLGLDPKNHSTIQFGAVIEDTNANVPLEDLPRFECLIKHKEYKGTPFAMSMHHELFVELALDGKSKKVIIPASDVAQCFYSWLGSNGFEPNKSQIRIQVAGKNFGTFDKLFLEELPQWKDLIIVSQRIIDPAILYWDPLVDTSLPNLEECKVRAGFTKTSVAHTAVEDALDVIELIRIKYKTKI